MPSIQIRIDEIELRRLIDGGKVLYVDPETASVVEVAFADISYPRLQEILRQERNARAMADGKAAAERQAEK